jgi:hypothetical protein
MTTFRAMCAELANYLQGRKDLECGWGEEDPEQDLIDRACAELAKPEPEGPTRDELRAMAVEFAARTPEEFALAVLARWGRPAVTPIPVSERLPSLKRGDTDFSPEGRIWWYKKPVHSYGYWDYGDRNCIDYIPYPTHWLPYWVMPDPDPNKSPLLDTGSESTLSEFSQGEMPLG